MYTEHDLNAIRAQLRKRYLLLLPLCLIFLAAAVTGAALRLEWLASLGTALMGCAIILCYDLFLRPLHQYAYMVREALQGIQRQALCTYQHITPDAEMVEGVLMRTMTVTQLDDKGTPYERIFYFDVLKDFPALTPGQEVDVTFHDRMVVSLQAR